MFYLLLFLFHLFKQPNKVKFVLKIVNVTEENMGNYSCHAENAIGESTKTFVVKSRDLQVRYIHVLIRRPN
jgi:hypothetical protein